MATAARAARVIGAADEDSFARARKRTPRATRSSAPGSRSDAHESKRRRRRRAGPSDSGEKSLATGVGDDCGPRRFLPGGAPKPRVGSSQASLAEARRSGIGGPKLGRRMRSTLGIPFVFEGGRRGRTIPRRPDLDSHRESLTTFAAARRDDGASRTRPHTHEEPVGAFSATVVGLIGPLHKEAAC
jgi:hypothetical protein